LFVKGNFKTFLIWPISLAVAFLFKILGYLNPNVLLINNYLVLLLVFGPALLVTLILVLNKILNP